MKSPILFFELRAVIQRQNRSNNSVHSSRQIYLIFIASNSENNFLENMPAIAVVSKIQLELFWNFSRLKLHWNRLRTEHNLFQLNIASRVSKSDLFHSFIRFVYFLFAAGAWQRQWGFSNICLREWGTYTGQRSEIDHLPIVSCNRT